MRRRRHLHVLRLAPADWTRLVRVVLVLVDARETRRQRGLSPSFSSRLRDEVTRVRREGGN